MHTPAQAVLGHFQLTTPDQPLQLSLRFNVAPTQLMPVVVWQDAARAMSEMRWGLVPRWSEPKNGARMINARSETAATKPAFRAAYKRRRCLVPSDGYFEWEKQGRKRLPHYIQMADERLFAYAGLWERWGDRQQGNYLETFTILTTDSNSLTASVHDRMPVILDEPQYDAWLNPDFDNLEELNSWMKPYPSKAMKMGRVSTHVNNVRHDDPSCLEPERELF